MTEDDDILYLWDTETGKPMGKIPTESEIAWNTPVEFDSDAARVRVTERTEGIDTRFASRTAVYDIASGKVVRREETPPADTRFRDIVWKTDERNAVFWNLDDDKPFFTIRLRPPAVPNVIGPIYFTQDGDAVICSTVEPPPKWVDEE